MIKRLFLLTLIASLSSSLVTLPTMAESSTIVVDETNSMGALVVSDEERDEFKESISEIKNVHLNDIAKQRILDERSASEVSIFNEEEDIETVLLGNEVEVYSDDEEFELFEDSSTTILPRQVDNSNEKYFPPISNQVGGSCTAWSTIYYQMTNNTNLIRDRAAKEIIDGVTYPIYENIMAPRWVYNLITSHYINNDYPDVIQQSGSWYREAYSAVSNFGCPTWAECDEDLNTKGSYSWNPGIELWNNAMENKIDDFMFLDINVYQADSIISPTETDSSIVNMKTLLADGYVLSFHTFIHSFNYLNNDEIHVIECEKKYNSEKNKYELSGSHIMTIVGYDDDKWIDLNNNGTDELAEYGAIKVANSWGTWKHDKGFIWIAYDALNKKSNILEDNLYREPVIVYNEVFHLQPKLSYTPLLVAELNIETNCRNQLSIEIGISESDEESPTKYRKITDCVVKHSLKEDETECEYHMAFGEERDEIALNFEGDYGYSSADFAFDLTSLLYEYDFQRGKDYKFYIKLTDSIDDGNYNKLNSYRLVNNVTGTDIGYIEPQNNVCDGTSISNFIEGSISNIVVRSDKEFNASFNNLIRAETVTKNNIYITDEHNLLGDKEIDGINPYTNVSLIQQEDRKTIRILPPTKGYIGGMNYFLHFNRNLLTDGGNSFDTEQAIPFYVLN